MYLFQYIKQIFELNGFFKVTVEGQQLHIDKPLVGKPSETLLIYKINIKRIKILYLVFKWVMNLWIEFFFY